MEPYIVYKINVTVQQLDYSKISDDPDDQVDIWRTIGYVTVGPQNIGDNTANAYHAGNTSGPEVSILTIISYSINFWQWKIMTNHC